MHELDEVFLPDLQVTKALHLTKVIAEQLVVLLAAHRRLDLQSFHYLSH